MPEKGNRYVDKETRKSITLCAGEDLASILMTCVAWPVLIEIRSFLLFLRLGSHTVSEKKWANFAHNRDS